MTGTVSCALHDMNMYDTEDSFTTRRVLLKAQGAAKRRRRRLLSAGENGAIVEYDHPTAPVMPGSPPKWRHPLPSRHLMTRPALLRYYGSDRLGAARRETIHPPATHEDYNYNWFIPVEWDAKERVAAVPKGAKRLRRALLAATAPSRALAKGTTHGVFDAGHLHTPICRQLPHGQVPSTEAPVRAATAAGGDEMILLVRSSPLEIPSAAQIAREESTRVAPKGREWDRQHALRHAVGASMQEAIIDTRIDPRYRRPGDFVRRNGRGEVVDARGRPMRAFKTQTSKGDTQLVTSTS